MNVERDARRPVRRRVRLAWLPILLLLSTVPGVQAQSASPGEEAGRRPVLFLGNDSLPPMNFVQGGKPTGIVVDIARAMAERMPSRVEIRLTPWAEAQRLVLEDQADALLQINPSPERLRLYDFSEPLLTSEFAIFIPAGRTGVVGKDDLRGLRVGVEEKGLPILLLRRDAQIEVRAVASILEGFRMLATGAVDAVVADRWVGSCVLAENRIEGVGVVAEPIERNDSAIAVRKGNTNLLCQINRALADIRSDGTYDRIVASWRPKEVVFETREQLRRQAILTAAIAVGLVAALAGVVALALEIRRRRRAEAAVRESAEIFEKSFHGNAAAMALTRSEDGRVIDVNERWTELTGLRREEIVGRTTVGHGLWKYPEDRIAMTREVLRQGFVRDREFTFCRENGQEWTALFSAQTVTVRGDSVLISSAVDITDRKRAEEALRQSNQDLEAFNQAMVGRELRMLELKQEINALCAQFGQPAKYAVEKAEEGH